MKYPACLLLLFLLVAPDLSAQPGRSGPASDTTVLRVAAGQTLVLHGDHYALDTLAMGPGALIRLTAPRVTLLVANAYLNGYNFIDGSGRAGAAGRHGRNGMNGRARFAPGRAGGDGGAGGNGTDLQLYLNVRQQPAQLAINLSGGAGGRGGNGGRGGTITPICGRVNQAASGGPSGVPGRGGRPGELRVIFGDALGRDKLVVTKRNGAAGATGRGGKPGSFARVVCPPGSRTRKLPGKLGKIKPPMTTIRSSTGAKLPDDHLDEGTFPSIPPAPSAIINPFRMPLPAAATFGTVHDRLQSALAEAGYRTPAMQLWRDGFALITTVEQIDAAGRPLEGVERWRQEVQYPHSPSIISYLKSLFVVQRGYFRVVVFLAASAGGQLTTAQPVSQRAALNWFKVQDGSLPADLRDRPFTDRQELSILIYEFVKEEDADPIISEPIRLEAVQHLTPTGLLAALRRE